MFCNKCGKEIPGGSAFCKYCGAKLMPSSAGAAAGTVTEVAEPGETPVKKRFHILPVIIPAAVLIIGIAGLLVFLRIGKPEDDTGRKERKAVEEEQEPAEEVVSEVAEVSKTEETEQRDEKPEEVPAAEPELHYVEKKVRITGAVATSYLATKSKDGQTYEPAHVIDGNYTTAWLEGKDDLGIGESLTLSFDQTERITRLRIYNGFMNTKYRYAINGKVTKLLVEFNDGTSTTVSVNTMNVPEEKVPFGLDEMDPTEVILEEPVTASGVTLTILDAVAGAKYNDVALSEVELYHEEAVSSDPGEGSIDDAILQAYEDYFRANFQPTEYGSYQVTLVYIDEDDIPEMIVEEGFDTGYHTILQYDNGKIHELCGASVISYVDKENILDLSWSDGETGEEERYRIKNHGLEFIAGCGAQYVDGDHTRYYRIDANGNTTDVSEEEYQNVMGGYSGRFTTPGPYWDSVAQAALYVQSEAAKAFQSFLDDEIKVDDMTFSERVTDYVYVREASPGAYLYDVDSDGEYELLTDNYYGYDIFDYRDGKLDLLDCGGGTGAICALYRKDGIIYVGHSDYSHGGRQSLFLTRYEDGKAAEELSLCAEYWDNANDRYDENSDFTFCDRKITMQEYEQYQKDFETIPYYEMLRLGY